jgi:hypothetical protein
VTHLRNNTAPNGQRVTEELLDDAEVEGLIITTPNDAQRGATLSKRPRREKTCMWTSRLPID